jgi:hypothetical protein
MIIIRDGGRLGNQLFQYAAVKTLAQTGQNLLLLGFEELEATFDHLDVKIINTRSPTRDRLQYYGLVKVARSLAQMRILATITDSQASAKVDHHRGLLPQIRYIDGSFFQGESFFDPQVLRALSLKEPLRNHAQRLLQELTQGSKTPVFVHVRRGDYIHWPDRQNPAVLSANYYHKCLEIVYAKIDQPLFIFTSDDYPYVQDIFGKLDHVYISQGSSLEDFALMANCPHGILSASSFSWWAAYFAHFNHPESIYMAPKFWIGHRLKSWYPPLIKSSFLTYIDAGIDLG